MARSLPGCACTLPAMGTAAARVAGESRGSRGFRKRIHHLEKATLGLIGDPRVALVVGRDLPGALRRGRRAEQRELSGPRHSDDSEISAGTPRSVEMMQRATVR